MIHLREHGEDEEHFIPQNGDFADEVKMKRDRAGQGRLVSVRKDGTTDD
jgi:hypothetical protein